MDKIWKVHPIQLNKLRENSLSRKYYQTLLRWIPFANSHFEEWDAAPNSGYFFGGAYWYGLDTARTVSVFAAVSVMGEYDEHITGVSRDILLKRAVQGIRYLLLTHDAGPEGYVRVQGTNPHCSGKKWGGKHENYFMASQTGYSISSLGLAAWMLWEHLDDETKELLQTVITYFADTWCDLDPRDGTYFDTQIEENSWIAQGISTAMDLFPDHPRHAHWKKRFIKWAYNSVTAPKDRWNQKLAGLREDTSAIPVPFISTSTVHPDYTAENHGFVHPTYLVLGINQRTAHSIFALMGDRPIEDAALFNNEHLYNRVIKLCCQKDGFIIPVQGQDWWYNRQHELLVTHTVLNVLHHQSDAALLEEKALQRVEQLQQSHDNGCYLEENGENCVIRPGFQTARDFENWAAQDMLYCYLLHAFGGDGAAASDPDEMETRLAGVHSFPYGGFVLNRTNSSISLFSWRNNILAATLPEQGIWLTTPTHTNYTGEITFQQVQQEEQAHQDHQVNMPSGMLHDHRIRTSDSEHLNQMEQGFGAFVVLSRGEGQLQQSCGFVSLPDGQSVYMEMFKAMKDCNIAKLETGRIGIRNESYSGLADLCPGERTLYMDDRKDVFKGYYSLTEPDQIIKYEPTHYLNMNDQIGYVLFGSQGIKYVNRHQYAKWMGVEDVLVLNTREHLELKDSQTLPPFMVLTLPNSGIEATKKAAEEACCLISNSDETMLLQTTEYLVYCHSAVDKRRVQGRKTISDSMWIDLYRGHNQIHDHEYEWSDELQGGSSGYVTCQYKLKIEKIDGVSLEIIIVSKQLMIANTSNREVSFILEDLMNLYSKQITLQVGGFHQASFE